MKIRFLSAVALIAALFGAQANAATITLDTRSLDTNPNAFGSMLDAYNGQSSTVTSRDLNQFWRKRIGNYSIAHLNISLDSDVTGTWLFDFGLDAGYGAELYVNGTQVEDRSDDLWWRYNWNNSDVLSGEGDIEYGSNSIDLYFAENCCNGRSSGRFSNDGGASWWRLSVAELDAATVTEPSTLLMLGLGLLGLAGARRRG